MTYADDMDDAEHGRADMTALLHEDPADWPAARHCPTHGWWTPRTHDYGCPTCVTADTDQAMRYDAHHDLTTQQTPPEHHEQRHETDRNQQRPQLQAGRRQG